MGLDDLEVWKDSREATTILLVGQNSLQFLTGSHVVVYLICYQWFWIGDLPLSRMGFRLNRKDGKSAKHCFYKGLGLYLLSFSV